MMKMKKMIALVLVAILTLVVFCGCETEADRVSRNISKEADNFNVQRRLVVVNTRTDKILFEMIGMFSINTNHSTNELEVICELQDGSYQKHFIELPENVTYVVEDISNTNVSKYHYELNILPETLIPFTFTFND